MFKKVSCVSIDIMNFDKPPASLAFLAGACEKAHKEYQCISFNNYFLKYGNCYNDVLTKLKTDNLKFLNQQEQSVIDHIIKKIIDYETDCVLISLFSYTQFSICKLFLETFRKVSTAKILIGGPGLRNKLKEKSNGKILLEQNLIDFYCLGEGDIVLPEFLQGNFKQIGLNYNIHEQEKWVPQIDDLDKNYLFSSYKKIDLQNYKNLEEKDGIIFSLSTSRGCVRSCSFCDVANIWPKYRYRSSQNIVDEIIKHHLDVGAINFTIVDSLINGSLKTFKDFNKTMIQVKQNIPSLKDFSYNGMFIVRDKKSHNEEFFANMKKAGCESLSIGVETGSEKLRYEMNKPFKNEDLDFHLEMCQKYNIKNTLLMFVGYPTETKEDYNQSLEMLDKYQKYLIDDTIIGINFAGVFNLLNDTPIYNNADSLGIHIDQRFDELNAVLRWKNNNNLELDIKERIRRDIYFRKYALSLRYPIPYADRFMNYLQHLNKNFTTATD